MSPEQILDYAKKEADKAAIVSLLGDQIDAYCGFAWVKITPARGKFINYLKANKIGHSGYSGGWEIGCSVYNPHPTQSMTFNEIVSRAFANALREHGINAYMQSRAD